jgi:drug/metabolite transporter (DMT)-like permease
MLLTVLALLGKKSFALSKKNHGGIFLLALIAVFHLWIQVTGLQYTTATNTGWIIGVSPVFMAILGFIVFKEYLGFIRIAGIVIAFFGLLLLISRGDLFSMDLLSNKGDFLILGSAFTWSVYSMVNKKISLSYSPLLTILFLFLMMAVLIAPFTINENFFREVENLSLNGWLAIAFLGLFCSGIAYVLWAQSLKEMESATVGAFLYFEPFVTVITAWLILEEEITLMIILSGLIITAGVLMVNVNFKELFKKIRRKVQK